ncbi:hypothetical protein [Piscirickettsia litoralis]|uniref:Uncharacterized protein n=1 Tax=Piscirickettsia litoralis TaxID=1891921 RepID=A0ABX3A085_9GAMM|nr:hypothetical protein [Piscirickettsia litoralis]ODN42242.1 hypothetical protein BGC07_03940 [Piscirickettsia litoralis]
MVDGIDTTILNKTTLKLHDKNQAFCPPQRTEIPKIHGITHGEIKSITSNSYDTIDENGCYQVIIPGAEQSQPVQVRKAESYSGKNHGMHFPLQSQTEVFLSFLQGHPDCPVITGAAYNSQHPNVVDSEKTYDHTLHIPNATQLIMSSQDNKPGYMLSTTGGYQDSHTDGDYVTMKQVKKYIEDINAEGDITKTIGTNKNVTANVRSARSISTFNTSAANISDINTTPTDFALDTNAVQHENFVSISNSEKKWL